MELFALAHPIDSSRFPDQTGFRWAVYHNRDWSNTAGCLGAGWAPSIEAAVFISDQAAVIAVKAARAAGGAALLAEPTVLAHDPILSGQGFVSFGGC